MKTVLKRVVLTSGSILLALTGSAFAERGYVGSEICFKCHPDQYNDFIVSGHSYKLSTAEDAMKRPIPLPKGYSWEDIFYDAIVLGNCTHNLGL